MNTSESAGVDMGEIEKIEEVGRGTYGLVYKCRSKKTNEILALKEIQFNISTLLPIMEMTMKEILVLKTVNHNNLVKYIGATMVNDRFLILTEYMDKGSIRSILESTGELDEKTSARYTKNVLQGLVYLHATSIIHRDVKCGNVLLNSRGQVKLTDFGLSKHVENVGQMDNHTFCGTLYFMSPELIEKNKYNSSVDIWAVGVTLVEMLTKWPIYFDLKGAAFVRKITDKSMIKPTFTHRPSAQLTYFLNLTFCKDATLRPNASDLLRSKFIRGAQ